MPSLAGLFTRKNKASSRNNRDTPTTSIYSNDLDSSQSSPTTEYITPDRSLPSSPNGRSNLHPDAALGKQQSNVYPSLATSSNRLRLPFSRKKASAAASSTSVATSSYGSQFGSPSRPSYMARNSTSAASEGEAVDLRRLRPPPSKSAIFAAYGDPHSALSTRSLPNERPPREEVPPIPPPVPPKKPSFFPWSKSTPSSPQATLRKPKPTSPKDNPSLSPTDSSFNLKSFRHIKPPSPNTSDISLSVPIPRPRGPSISSESSQRISVAAFREVQARRSTADSPVPSFRAPSPLSPQLPNNYPVDPTRGRASPRPHHSQSAPQIPTKQTLQSKRSSGLAYTSDSDESSESESEYSDHSGGHNGTNGIVRRNRTLTKRNNSDIPPVQEPIKMRATKSEAGHGPSYTSSATARRDFLPAPRIQSSHILMSQFAGPSRQNSNDVAQGRQDGVESHPSLGSQNGSSRPRASVSTSAISPSAAAKRASIIAAANGPEFKRNHIRHSSIPVTTPPKKVQSSSSSSSDSEDDAPLASLVAPRRPGSAMSSVSNSNASRSNVNLNRPTSKPLIDIHELTNGRRPTNPKGPQSNEGFTPGATLIASRGAAPNPAPIPLPQPKIDSPVPTSLSPPTRFVSPPSSPTKELTQFNTAPNVPAPVPTRTANLSNTARKGTLPEQKKDIFTERLTRVVQLKVTSGSSTITSTSSGNGGGKETDTDKFKTTLESPSKSVDSRHSKRLTPDADLAAMLGASVSLISRNGESETESESDDDDDEDEETDKEEPKPDRIAPIPIKQRSPPPSFSVTSRPPLPKPLPDSINTNGSGPGPRQRSSTLIPSSMSASSFGTSSTGRSTNPGTLKPIINTSSSAAKEPVGLASITTSGQRQRSSTMLPSGAPAPTMTPTFPMPSRPFARGRTESPASSTGDSSSGRAPFTPNDGSEVGSAIGSTSERKGGREGPKSEGWSGGVSGLPLGGARGVGKHIKRRSVSFEDDPQDDMVPATGKGKETRVEGEERRRERRRSEAKAAIELGNVINGRGPVAEDDDDDDIPINQSLGGGGRMSAINPMMAMGGPVPMQMGFGATPGMSPGWNGMNPGWQQPQQAPQMLSPNQFMPQSPDPNFMLAHQQAMMYAKQAYQMAVAQQAMAAAGDEWERGSSVGGFGGGSVYGGVPSPSVMGSPFGMGMGMGGMSGMGMSSPGNGWSSGSVIFPPSSRSMYGGMSGARSDYGGPTGGGGGGWNSSRSSYGENFGPSSNRLSKASQSQGRPVYGQRDSGYFPPVPPIPQNSGGSPSSRGTPRSRTASQPASPGRAVRKAPPPSSWKAGV